MTAKEMIQEQRIHILEWERDTLRRALQRLDGAWAVECQHGDCHCHICEASRDAEKVLSQIVSDTDSHQGHADATSRSAAK